jgi:glycosyltransferase involved in cell wall biosynthesis
MNNMRKKFTICIPSYNRAKYLPELLESIFGQDFQSFEVLICEDCSPEREKIAQIAMQYEQRFRGQLIYHENDQNLGYDGNIRNLISKAQGEFCFFMGNDDIMCPGALNTVNDLISRYPKVGLILKSYSWFDGDVANINQTVRYFTTEHFMNAGTEAISICYRRSGVISGYIVHRDLANEAATDIFDGTLYYQMHLTTYILAKMPAVSTPEVLVLCRNGVAPDFGNSSTEKGLFLPGCYTPEARVRMISGIVSILNHHRKIGYISSETLNYVIRDYANYFYPYIKDQLHLPFRQFFLLYRSFGKMGFARFPLFHMYFILGYILGERRFDNMTRFVRLHLGRSPKFGYICK